MGELRHQEALSPSANAILRHKVTKNQSYELYGSPYLSAEMVGALSLAPCFAKESVETRLKVLL